jgi:RHS repeat-associated protein
MLARVIRPDGDAVTFAYDPLGRRIAKTYKGKTTKWVWDGNVPLHEWTEEACAESNAEVKSVPDANADVIQDAHQAKIAPISAQGPPDAQGNAHDSQRHSHDAPRHSREGGNPSHPGVENKAFAGISDAKSAPKLTTWLFEPESFSPMAKIVDGQSYSIVTDHLGTPFEMYNSAGQRTWAAELDIYGAVRVVQEGNAVDCPFRYPGQYEDEETGLYYNRFRYYDPEAGGYVSQDPIGLAGGNPTLYGYVRNPLSWVDELGLKCKSQVSGEKGRKKATHDLERNGYTIVAEEVTMNVNGKKIRADIVAKDRHGNLHVFEVKHGSGGLTKNQAGTGVFNMSTPSNTTQHLGGGTIRPSQGTQGTFTVATGSQRGKALGGRGKSNDATFSVLKYN